MRSLIVHKYWSIVYKVRTGNCLYFYSAFPVVATDLIAISFFQAYKECSPRSCAFWFIQLIKLVLTIGMTGLFFYTAYYVILSYPIMYLLLLCYP
jgi:hypothetical protein